MIDQLGGGGVSRLPATGEKQNHTASPYAIIIRIYAL